MKLFILLFTSFSTLAANHSFQCFEGRKEVFQIEIAGSKARLRTLSPLNFKDLSIPSKTDLSSFSTYGDRSMPTLVFSVPKGFVTNDSLASDINEGVYVRIPMNLIPNGFQTTLYTYGLIDSTGPYLFGHKNLMCLNNRLLDEYED